MWGRPPPGAERHILFTSSVGVVLAVASAVCLVAAVIVLLVGAAIDSEPATGKVPYAGECEEGE